MPHNDANVGIGIKNSIRLVTAGVWAGFLVPPNHLAALRALSAAAPAGGRLPESISRQEKGIAGA